MNKYILPLLLIFLTGCLSPSRAPNPIEKIPDLLLESYRDNPLRNPGYMPHMRLLPFTAQKWHNRIPLVDPVQGSFLTSPYGWRLLKGKNNFHDGIDMVVAKGGFITAPISGTVVHVDSNSKINKVVIYDGKAYYHSLRNAFPMPGIQIGVTVTRGQRIATQKGSHFLYAMHFIPGGTWTMMANENAIDPLYAYPRVYGSGAYGQQAINP